MESGETTSRSASRRNLLVLSWLALAATLSLVFYGWLGLDGDEVKWSGMSRLVLWPFLLLIEVIGTVGARQANLNDHRDRLSQTLFVTHAGILIVLILSVPVSLAFAVGKMLLGIAG